MVKGRNVKTRLGDLQDSRLQHAELFAVLHPFAPLHEDLVSLRQTLRVTCDLKQPKLVGDESMTWDEKETEDRDLGALKDAIKSMRVVSRAKVTQDRIYSMAYHPERVRSLRVLVDDLFPHNYL